MAGTIVMSDTISKVIFLAIYLMGLYATVAIFYYKIILKSNQLVEHKFLFGNVVIRLSEIKCIYNSPAYSAETVEDIHGKKIRIYNNTMGADFLLEEVNRRRNK